MRIAIDICASFSLQDEVRVARICHSLSPDGDMRRAFTACADKLRSGTSRAQRKDTRRRASAKAACNVPCNLVEKKLMTNILKVGVAAAVIALGAGCTDLKPLQAEVDSLKSQVSKLSGDLDSVKTAADGASRAAASAQQAATSAQNSANQALSAAQAAQQCCDANSEKLNRMFEKSMSK
jgi:murein lipoprotein